MSTAPYERQNELKYYRPEELVDLDQTRIPEHIAVIMDGNRRWAKQATQNVTEGHRSGADILLDILKAAKELGIRVVTLFVFSTENWHRSHEEVMGLMWLFETYIRKQIPEMVQQRIRFATIGDLSKFPDQVLAAIQDAKAATKDCEAMEVIFAMNYGARDEMRRAVAKMIAEAKAGKLQAEEITEQKISAYLDTALYPDPDLLIRTGGDQRISNFLLWQLSYTELYITDTLWPSFSPRHLLDAVIEFQKRERRLGV